MSENTTDAMRLSLAGDWTVRGVAEQFPLLTLYLSRLPVAAPTGAGQTSPTHRLTELDLAGVTALDACGCQLLAQFSRTLQLQGGAPRISNVPEPFVATVQLLGFYQEFDLSH